MKTVRRLQNAMPAYQGRGALGKRSFPFTSVCAACLSCFFISMPAHCSTFAGTGSMKPFARSFVRSASVEQLLPLEERQQRQYGWLAVVVLALCFVMICNLM